MATKTMPFALKGGHTAGIFADMSVDGPPIGTLVTVVDRAKNLPNRKTIGKQDPYCAARLGKEAKKTATDVRGGQTPKWDQELRFTVHDSPDYYQLKISIFTDDKKTDLIGDAWIDLKAIIVPGGGQNDVWQTLMCKGKYAGEIRLEITYYDSRPKPDKPAVKRRLPNASDQDMGSVKQRAATKRRPLPSDPVTGEAPSPPPSAPQPAVHASPDHHQQTPPRPHAHVPTQSPLQAVEYSTPAARQHPDQPREAYDTPSRHYDESAYGPNVAGSPYDQPVSRGQHSPLPEHHTVTLPEGDWVQSQPIEDECPPPPPAHRSMPSGDGQELVRRGIYDSPPQMVAPSTPMRHGVLKSEALRHSAPTYPGRPLFRPYDPNSPGSSPSESHNGSPVPPRYHSYDPASDSQHRSMQPTVEDVPESPPGVLESSYKHGGPRSTSNDEMMFESAPRSETMDLMRSPAASSRHASLSPGHGRGGLPTSASLVHVRDQSNGLMYQSLKRQSQRPSPRPEFEAGQARGSPGCALPDVPASLSPGMDPGLSREILEQIYEEHRHDGRHATPPGTTPTRGRHDNDESQAYRSHSPGYVARLYEGRPDVTYSGGPETQLVRRGHASPSPSPSPQHRIPRKSVSPGPPAAEDRMISDTPFSPDSYDALNPALGSPREPRPKTERIEMGGKIITHDGREVDPSDHLPMESWAPEPEPKGGQMQASPDSRSRPTPSGAQPMPPSGRRPLRIARAQPSTTSPPSYHFDDSPRTPPVSGRGRLQKKAARGPPGPSAAMSSPLAPVSTDNFQERQIVYTRTGGPRRWGSWDYPNENHAPQHNAAPPIPAKIPFTAMSGANGGGELALMHEMQRIDIGSGRSRRRGGY
ncbi:c2 domain-containing protein [Hirsutella rhossiliensis]|uniref:C2 domain-containing protein n=1 Tax=Hirsutella rhossiliensis TaxID=111463 RepID=A0A9P8SIF0_9HYPO|nr:c2 domain-containing protein [Hirsutella rhossiliensis]KAH0963826.1 c2 domain-containing protein [Hirsutella rhossiliensis]